MTMNTSNRTRGARLASYFRAKHLLGATCLLGALFALSSCGGSSGGIFGGISRAVGQAVRPISGLIESNPIPLGDAPVALIDFADGAVGRSARTTEVGRTDANGNFAVDIPAQTVAIIVVTTETEQGPVRIAGLVSPNEENLSKNFDGITDIACEAALTAINDGTVSPDDVTEDRVTRLEVASKQYLDANPGTNFFDKNQVSTAARAVREATNVGANAAPAGAFGPASPEATPTPTPPPSESQECTAGLFTCDDGSEVCRDLVCNQQSNCPDGSDEKVELCTVQSSCCEATGGCPSETATSCGETCCCCEINQICNREAPSMGCIQVAGKSYLDSSDPLSKLFFVGPYWE